MMSRIFAYVLLTIILPTEAWAYRCELPSQFKLSKGDTVEYKVWGDHLADYKVIKMGDKNVATIEPETISLQDVGLFKILAVENGSTKFTIERRGTTKRLHCTVEVIVAE